jgi:hypothetical protein
MGVTVCLPLFGNPGQELEEGAPVKGQHLRSLAAELQERLLKAAAMLDQLALAGWSSRLAMFDVILLHREVQTRDEALSRLQALGIDPEELMILEDIEEEDELDESA